MFITISEMETGNVLVRNADIRTVITSPKRGEAKTRTETMTYLCTFCNEPLIQKEHIKNHMKINHFVNIDNNIDLMSCLKRVVATVETPTRSVSETGNDQREHRVATNVEPRMGDGYVCETNDATAFLEGLMGSPREAKTEHFLFDVDDEDFEDDIIILDEQNAIQHVKEEPRTPERGDARALETVDEYLERNERLHTFSMPVERKPCETPVVVEEAIDVPPRDGNSTVAIDQLLRLRPIFKKGTQDQGGKQYMFPCTNVCNKVLKRKGDVVRHLKKQECPLRNHPPHYHCLGCGVQTDNVLIYIKHWQNHSFKANQCPWCLAGTKGALFPHVQEHICDQFKESDKEIFTCRDCGIPVTSHSRLQHWESHLLYNEGCVERNKSEGPGPSNALTMVCHVCSKLFHRSGNLKRHLVEHVLGDALQRKGHEESLKCDICKEGTTFETVAAFKQHWHEHADLPLYRRKMCAKPFVDGKNLARHIIAAHVT